MAFAHGKDAVFKLDDSGGTLFDYSPYVASVNMPRSIATAETTTFAATSDAKTFIVGLSEAGISVSGFFDSAADAKLAGILGQSATVTFEYGPAGSTAGFIKYTGEAIMTSYQIQSQVGDVVAASFELQVTGAVTRTTWP